MRNNLTIHGQERLRERTRLTESEFLQILNEYQTISAGLQPKETKWHRLFYSPKDDTCFVAIQDVKSRSVITILTLEYHKTLAWEISENLCKQAKKKKPEAPKENSNYLELGAKFFDKSLKTIHQELGVLEGETLPTNWEHAIKNERLTEKIFQSLTGISTDWNLDEIVLYCPLEERAIRIPQTAFIKTDLNWKFENARVGDTITCTIKEIQNHYVIADIGGLDGRLHISETSWGYVENMTSQFELNQTLTAKIIDLDWRKQRAILSTRSLTENPWEKTLKAGQTLPAITQNTTRLGVFITIENITGFISHQEWNWIAGPHKEILRGSEIQVKILEADPKTNKLVLSHRATTPNPWPALLKTLRPNKIVKGKIVQVHPSKAIVEIKPNVFTHIHQSDVSWRKIKSNLTDVLKPGELIKGCILHIDSNTGYIQMGIKQLKPNPWENIQTKYKAGDIITGTVAAHLNCGIIFELENDLDALLHKSQIPKKTDPESLKVGQKIKVAIRNIETETNRIQLTLTPLQNKIQTVISASYEGKLYEVPIKATFHKDGDKYRMSVTGPKTRDIRYGGQLHKKFNNWMGNTIYEFCKKIRTKLKIYVEEGDRINYRIAEEPEYKPEDFPTPTETTPYYLTPETEETPEEEPTNLLKSIPKNSILGGPIKPTFKLSNGPLIPITTLEKF
jgi:predicted RNA-binding protein with RPS1 domain